MHQLTYSDVNGHNSPAFLYRNTTLVLIINQSDKCVITSFPVTISIKRADFLWICDLYLVTLFCFTQRFQRLHLSSMLSTCPVPHCPVSSGKWEHVAQLLQGCMCADLLTSQSACTSLSSQQALRVIKGQTYKGLHLREDTSLGPFYSATNFHNMELIIFLNLFSGSIWQKSMKRFKG